MEFRKAYTIEELREHEKNLQELEAVVNISYEYKKHWVNFWFSKKSYDLGHNPSYEFPIEERCDTPEKLLAWVAHLSSKEWFTNRVCKRMLNQLDRLWKEKYDKKLLHFA